MRTISIALATFLLLLPHTQATTKTTTPYKSIGGTATLVGAVSVKGKTVAPRRIDMSADLSCLASSLQQTESIVRNGDTLANVFVYLKSGEPLRALSFETPHTPAVLRSQECQFAPRVLGVRVNQQVSIENHDPTFHNFHQMAKINKEFNRSQPPYSPPFLTAFESVEFGIPLRCNQHPWEKAYISVLDHPFFTTTNLLGGFEIRGIPVGKYQVAAWHEVLGEQEMEITLVPGEVRSLDFVFVGNAKSGHR